MGRRIRLSILLAGCFLLVSTAWADDLGYVDCASHPESAQVFSKARQTPDSLGTVTCGERFTILVYGFVFSRVQTKDGQVGYIYSNLISVDHGGTAFAKGATAPAPATSQATPTNASAVPAKLDSRPVTTTPAPDKPAPARVEALFPTPPVPAVTASGRSSASAPTPVASANVQAAAAASQPAPAAPAPATPAPSASSAPTPMPAPASTQTQPAASSSSAQPQASAPAQPGPLFPTTLPQPPPPPSDTTSRPATAEPAPPPAAVWQPQAEAAQPEAAQPAPEPVRDTGVRSSWERPLPGVSQNFLVQLYSGYAFDRVGGSSATNLSGAMGSFGYNLKPWLQIVGDTSYNYVTGTGVKNVLYGNHFGGRFFYHPGRWRMTPFVEGLVGGSRYDITISGLGGGTTSQNCISYKAGGGVDFRVSHRWAIRVIDLDYYRTSFGTNMTQNNYWASAGVVLRLFGSGASE
jgi:hypothetical protein